MLDEACDNAETNCAESEMRNRNRSKSPHVTRERTSSNNIEKVYTKEQLEAVKVIQKSKDFYEILGVEKEASDEDLKRSYKK